jgi:hypothetical protein
MIPGYSMIPINSPRNHKKTEKRGPHESTAVIGRVLKKESS